jgi:hypothetical protein
MRTFRDLIKQWPTRTAFAREMGIGYEAAAAMYGRAFIHPHYWPRLLEAARRRKIKLKPADLIAWSDKRKRRRRRRPKEDDDTAIAA